MPKGAGGYQPDTKAPSSRRADFDLNKRLKRMESAGGVPGPPGTDGTDGADGAPGPPGVGVPVGGTTAQVLAKKTATNYDTEWVSQTGITQAAADTRYLNVTGDIATGTLTVAATGDAVTGGGVQLRADTGRMQSWVVDPAGSSEPNWMADRKGTLPASTGARYATLMREGVTIGTITIASATAVAYNTTSDPRLKETVGPITDAAERVRVLGDAVYRGVWIGDEGEGQEWDMVDATDVAVAAPYAVPGEADAVDEDGSIVAMQVNYPALVPLLTAALADALARIEALEARLA